MTRSSITDGGARQEARDGRSGMAERVTGGSGRLAVRATGIAGAGLLIGAAVWFGAGLDIGGLAFLDAGERMTGGTAAEAAMSATAQSRRMGAFHADIDAFWARAMGPEWISAQPVFFSGSMPSPCGGRGGVTGHFHCAADRVAGFDLLLAAETESRLREAADAGQALLVGRIVAGAARDMTGVRGRDAVLQGDCMAGVWAGATFGMADEGLYARALAAARRSMQAVAGAGPDAPQALNDFPEGDLANRDAAFRAGAASGDVGTCAAF